MTSCSYSERASSGKHYEGAYFKIDSCTTGVNMSVEIESITSVSSFKRYEPWFSGLEWPNELGQTKIIPFNDH